MTNCRWSLKALAEDVPSGTLRSVYLEAGSNNGFALQDLIPLAGQAAAVAYRAPDKLIADGRFVGPRNWTHFKGEYDAYF